MKWSKTFSAGQRRTNFIIAGAENSGAEILGNCLAQHAEIGLVSGTHFFEQRTHFRKNRPRYSVYLSQFSGYVSRKCLGEVAPAYLYWPPLPKRLHDFNPAMKIMVVLSNPVERTYRHWDEARKSGAENFSFTEALNAETFAGREEEPNPNGHAYIYRGFYAEQLERLWEFFPKDQTLVLRYESLCDDLPGTADGICEFLGISPFANFAAPSFSLSKTAMNSYEIKFLTTLFAPEIKKLEQLLGWNCNNWLSTQ